MLVNWGISSNSPSTVPSGSAEKASSVGAVCVCVCVRVEGGEDDKMK